MKSIPFDHLKYRAPNKLRTICYFDSDYAKNPDDRISITGIHGTLDNNSVIYTTSQGQGQVSLLVTEAEY